MMSQQLSFTDLEYSVRRQRTKKEAFLDMMDAIVPWSDWIDIIKPFYYPGKKGRRPRGIETMLRMYLLQIWYSLSDEGVEEEICDSYAMRKFMKLDYINEQVPDATTLLTFRHIIEKHGISKEIFKFITEELSSKGLMMHGGTIVDATIIAAPSSTKNKTHSRDAEMCQTKKGNEWHFGMKAHIGVDAGSGYIHSVTATPANNHDITEAHNLIREDDHVVYGDSGYIGISNREEIKNDPQKSSIEYRINKKPGKMRKEAKKWNPGAMWDKKIEKIKSSVRSKVEHAFNILKNIFGYKKTVYRGIYKNLVRLEMSFACANLYMCAKAGGFNRSY